MATRPAIPDSERDINVEWIQQALAAGGLADSATIAAITVENIGSGVGFVGTILRCNLSYQSDEAALPRSMIVKLHSSHAETVATARMLQLVRAGSTRSTSKWLPTFQCARLLSSMVISTSATTDLSGAGRPSRPDHGGPGRWGQPGAAMIAVRAIARMHGRYWNRVDQPPVPDFTMPALRTPSPRSACLSGESAGRRSSDWATSSPNPCDGSRKLTGNTSWSTSPRSSPAR